MFNHSVKITIFEDDTFNLGTFTRFVNSSNLLAYGVRDLVEILMF